MKRLSYFLKFIGIMTLFIGGAGMDSTSIIAPIVMVVCGLLIALIGEHISEVYA